MQRARLNYAQYVQLCEEAKRGCAIGMLLSYNGPADQMFLGDGDPASHKFWVKHGVCTKADLQRLRARNP